MSMTKYFIVWMLSIITRINAQCASDDTYCLTGNETFSRNVFGGNDISHYNDLYSTWNYQGERNGCEYFKSNTGLWLQYIPEGEVWIISHELGEDDYTDYGEDALFARCNVGPDLDNCTNDEWSVYGSGNLFISQSSLSIEPGECQTSGNKHGFFICSILVILCLCDVV